MPWSAADAAKHNKAANTLPKRRKWAKIANRVLGDTGDEGRAIRIANSQIESRTLRALNRLFEQAPVPTDPAIRKKARTSIGYPPPGMIRMTAYPAGKGKGLKGKGIDAEYPDTAEGHKIAKAQAWILPSKITKAGKKTYRF